jgi:hypothetical protein
MVIITNLFIKKFNLSATQKVINYILFLIFLAFAIFQLNDPDGIVWFSIYLTVGLICLLQNFVRIPKIILIIATISLLVYSAFHFSLFIDYLNTDHKGEIFGEMVYEKPYLEGAREFLGLLIASAAIFYQKKI